MRTRLAAMISGLDIRYDVGGPAHPLSGARLPHLRLRTGEMICSAAELLRSGRGLLLGLGAPPPPIAAGLADRVDTVTAHAAADEPLEGTPDAVLVRPDGHVAWAGGADGDGEGLGRAVARWFGSP
ncbi:hypothetical protein HFP71_00010 [Streptomyces sp. ARC32]